MQINEKIFDLEWNQMLPFFDQISFNSFSNQWNSKLTACMACLDLKNERRIRIAINFDFLPFILIKLAFKWLKIQNK